MGITTTALVAEFGAFYKKGTQNVADLMQKLYKVAEFDELFTYTPTEDTVIRKMPVTTDAVLQGFQKAFTAKGGTTIGALEIPLYHIKADDSIYPDDIEATYAGFLAANSLNRADWPISKFVADLFIKQMVEDIDANAYGAVYAAPTAGTAGAASAAFQGFKKTIQLAIASGALAAGNVIATGALSTDPETFVGQIETFVAGIDADIRKKMPITIAMSNALETRYKNGMRLKYNIGWQMVTELLSNINHPNIVIKGFNSMSGSKIFASTKAAMVLGIKRGSQDVKAEESKREVALMHDHWRGYGCSDWRFFWTNDLENS